MSQSILSVRMDSGTKEAFASFCEEVGMSVSTAINLFARQTVREQRIPFAISTGRTGDSKQDAVPEHILAISEITSVVSRAASRFPGIKRVILFGSYARGEATPESDIDLRIEYEEGELSLFQLSAFSGEVRELTGKSVDIVSKHDLGDCQLARAIDEEGLMLYERSEF